MLRLLSPWLLAAVCLAANWALAEGYSVGRFGAKGDKKANDTRAVQAAIDACAKAGGGTVVIPPGDYLCGTLELRSHVSLYLDSGATLWASRNPDDYQAASCLVYGEDVENVSIVGFGTIRGIGDADLGRKPSKDGGKEKWPEFRAGIMRLERSRNVELRSFKILLSDTWTLHFRDCENVLVDGLSILNNYFHTNSDGIDPVSCRNVRISNCHIVAGDDCIVLKSHGNGPCENVVVTNCTLETVATALKLGTESPHDFRNIHFSNCTIRNSTVGIGLYLKDGGTMERVTFSSIDIETPRPRGLTNLETAVYPIFVDIERRNEDSKIGRIRDLAFENIQITTGAGILLQGMPDSPLENVSFSGVTVRVEEPADYSNRKKHVGGRRTTRDDRDTLYARQPSYATLAYINGLAVDGLRLAVSRENLDRYDRSALAVFESSDAVIRNVFRQSSPAKGVLPVVALHNCRNALVSDCLAVAGSPPMVGISGERSEAIAVNRTGMHAARTAIVTAGGAPDTAIIENTGH